MSDIQEIINGFIAEAQKPHPDYATLLRFVTQVSDEADRVAAHTATQGTFLSQDFGKREGTLAEGPVILKEFRKAHGSLFNNRKQHSAARHVIETINAALIDFNNKHSELNNDAIGLLEEGDTKHQLEMQRIESGRLYLGSMILREILGVPDTHEGSEIPKTLQSHIRAAVITNPIELARTVVLDMCRDYKELLSRSSEHIERLCAQGVTEPDPIAIEKDGPVGEFHTILYVEQMLSPAKDSIPLQSRLQMLHGVLQTKSEQLASESKEMLNAKSKQLEAQHKLPWSTMLKNLSETISRVISMLHRPFASKVVFHEHPPIEEALGRLPDQFVSASSEALEHLKEAPRAEPLHLIDAVH